MIPRFDKKTRLLTVRLTKPETAQVGKTLDLLETLANVRPVPPEVTATAKDAATALKELLALVSPEEEKA